MKKTVEQKIKDKELLKRYYRLPSDLVRALNIAAATEGITNELFVIKALQERVKKLQKTY